MTFENAGGKSATVEASGGVVPDPNLQGLGVKPNDQDEGNGA